MREYTGVCVYVCAGMRQALGFGQAFGHPVSSGLLSQIGKLSCAARPRRRHPLFREDSRILVTIESSEETKEGVGLPPLVICFPPESAQIAIFHG